MGKSKVVIVQNLVDFPTPVAGVITLEDNTTYQINGSVNVGTNTITQGISNTIFGLDKSDDQLIYTGTSSFINGVNKDFSLTHLTVAVVSVGGSVFNLTGTTNLVEISDVIFGSCQSIGIIEVGKILVFKSNLLINCTNGIVFNSATNGDIIIADIVGSVNLGTITVMKLNAGSYNSIVISRCMIETQLTQTALDIDATIVPTGSAILAINSFEGAGSYVVGVTPSSTGWLFTGNQNIANRVRELFVSVNDMSGTALTTPTTAAAALTFLSTTGARFLSLRGGAAQDDGISFTIQIPSDYKSGGRFDINFTTQTTALNVKFFMGLAKVNVGSDFGTLTESPLSVVVSGTTQYQRKETFITPITTVFNAGDIFIVKLWRDPDDAQDTAPVTAYISNVQFTYNSI